MVKHKFGVVCSLSFKDSKTHSFKHKVRKLDDIEVVQTQWDRLARISIEVFRVDFVSTKVHI